MFSFEHFQLLQFIGGINHFELLLFALVLILLFGSAKLPSLMRNLGKSATEFKKGMREETDEPVESRIDSRKDTPVNT